MTIKVGILDHEKRKSSPAVINPSKNNTPDVATTRFWVPSFSFAFILFLRSDGAKIKRQTPSNAIGINKSPRNNHPFGKCNVPAGKNKIAKTSKIPNKNFNKA